MQLYRFDNLNGFPALDTFSSGCANIHTSIKPWSQISDADETGEQSPPCTSANPTTMLPHTTSNCCLSLMEIAVQGLADAQPIEVVLALPAVGIAGHLNTVDLLVDSCSQGCQISIDASDVGGAPFTIDLGSTIGEAMESLTCAFGSKQPSTDSRDYPSRVNVTTLIQMHRLRLCWPVGVIHAKVKLASLHVYGHLRRASSVLAKR